MPDIVESSDLVLEFVEANPQITVGDLVKQLHGNHGIPVDEVARMVYQMWEERKITLEDPDPPRSVLRYAWSLYSLWFWLLVSVVALTTLSIYVLPQGPPYIYLRYVAGSLSVLYLPGATLIEALYPSREDLEPLEKLALSIGLSLALVPLVGMALNYLPYGIRLNSVFVSLSMLTLTLAAVTLSRKIRLLHDGDSRGREIFKADDSTCL